MNGYLDTRNKTECYGCGACVQACPCNALYMHEDAEGFRYPVVENDKCVKCGICHKVCPHENPVDKCNGKQFAFGGYVRDESIRNESTSGGAFSALADTWCDENYVIFGAASEGLNVYHTSIQDKAQLQQFRKSKYLQSNVGNSYNEVKKYLSQNRKVLFSGTPCQIAGLKAFLGDVKQDNLLTVEVVCEGVPSPLYIRRYAEWLLQRHGAVIKNIDYRYKDGNKWDFQVMYIELANDYRIKIDRWFNPFWSIWLNHLMSRPSCYKCPFTTKERCADITLGDLWGVHIYCSELYGSNKGASLIICNSIKGQEIFSRAKSNLYGHDLDFSVALKYQSPMRKNIDYNDMREIFIKDLQNENLNYKEIVMKWGRKPTLRLLFSKYIWGNAQKVFLKNCLNKIF